MIQPLNNLYDFPLYYDIVFSWNLAKEADFLKRAIKWHGQLDKAKSILEPACGTGRMLREFAKIGATAVGYDISFPSLHYAAKRSLELGNKIEIVCCDMSQPSLEGPFDGAYNLVGSFTYLLDDDQVIHHLRKTSESLRDGAVYIIQMSLTSKGDREYPPQTWSGERGDIEVTFTWGRETQDFEECINYDYSVMEVKDGDKTAIFKEKHPQRLWTRKRFEEILDASGVFQLVSIYDVEQRTIPLGTLDLDQLHVPYFVLRRQ